VSDEETAAAEGGQWGEWFFLGLVLPLAVLGLVAFASWDNVVDAFDAEDRSRQAEVVFFPLVVAGIAWLWVPLTFTWARTGPLGRRGRVLLVALAVVPAVALVLAGAAAAVVAYRG
jgi:hypothetical protein